MNSAIQMHDVVALLEDVSARHFVSGQPIVLPRGQIGTVVMTYDGTSFEVEFAGPEGRAYALLSVPANQVMLLHEKPVSVAA